MTFKNKEEGKKYHREYMKIWKEKNKDKWKQIQNKSESRPERKLYIKNWWIKNVKVKRIKERFKRNHPGIQKIYDKTYRDNHPDRIKAKDKRYYLSIKGIINRLKKSDRYKFKIENKELTIQLIEYVNSRDKFCVYCGKEFINLNNFKQIQYDHINPFIPFSKLNIVRCCDICNYEKSNANVIEWCKFKKYNPSPIVLELLKQQNEKTSI